MRQELQDVINELLKLDQQSQLWEYSQTLLELTYKKKYVTLGQDENSSNVECWVQMPSRKVYFYATIYELLQEVQKCLS